MIPEIEARIGNIDVSFQRATGKVIPRTEYQKEDKWFQRRIN